MHVGVYDIVYGGVYRLGVWDELLGVETSIRHLGLVICLFSIPYMVSIPNFISIGAVLTFYHSPCIINVFVSITIFPLYSLCTYPTL